MRHGDMDVRQRLAANLKRMRRERDWSQEELADRSGLDRTYISGIERKLRHPTITSVEKLTRAFGVSFGDLLDREPS